MIFVNQTRIGKSGKSISINKFRTMKEGPHNDHGDELGFRKELGDGEYTKIGRFLRRYWLDETPQLLNVLRGEMRIVGFRPLLQKHYDNFPPNLREMLDKETPGIISPLYAERGSLESLESMFRVGKEYVSQRSEHPFLTDMKYLTKAYWNAFQGYGGKS